MMEDLDKYLQLHHNNQYMLNYQIYHLVYNTKMHFQYHNRLLTYIHHHNIDIQHNPDKKDKHHQIFQCNFHKNMNNYVWKMSHYQHIDHSRCYDNLDNNLANFVHNKHMDGKCTLLDILIFLKGKNLLRIVIFQR